MRVQVKLLLLIFCLIGAFFIGLQGMNRWSIKTFHVLRLNREEELLRIFKNILILKEMPLKIFCDDYSNRNGLTIFMETGDRRWAQTNLESGLQKYHGEAVWIFQWDRTLAYFYSQKMTPDTRNKISPQMIRSLFAEKQSTHFFMDTQDGLLEIRGTVISASSDPYGYDMFQGYLFIGHLWDDGYIREIAELMGGEAQIVDPENPLPIPEKYIDPLMNVHLSVQLRGWNEQPLRILKIFIFSSFLQKHAQNNQMGINISILFSAVLILFISTALIVWVTNPLKKIGRCLKEDNVELIQPLLSNQSEFGHISRLILEFFDQKERLKYTACHDPLTEVLNRGALMTLLDQQLSRSKRYGEPFGIIVLDLDFFKKINDTYGHLAGDKVLKNIAAMIRKEIRSCDSVGRYGGEEFIIVIPGCNAVESSKLAARIKEKIAQTPIEYNEYQIEITVSMGIAEYQKETDSLITDMISRADVAMYQAKEEGRNRIVIANRTYESILSLSIEEFESPNPNESSTIRITRSNDRQ